MGLLQTRPASQRHLGARGVALLAIGGLHAAAVAGLLHMGIAPAEGEVAPPIQAVLLQSDQPRQAAPELQVQMELPAIEIPPVSIMPFEIPVQPTALRVALTPPPAAAAVTAAPAAIDADIPVELETIDYLERVEPRYPPAARRARAQGTVFLRVIIGTDGRPREVRVEKTSGHALLDAAACSAVEKWLFRPHRENGVARTASVIVPLKFEISSRRS